MSTPTHDGFLDLVGLEAISWTLTVIAILLSVGRYAIRYASKKKLNWDDLTHLLALLTMIAMVALYQSLFFAGYFLTAVQRQLVPPPSQKDAVQLYLRLWSGSYGIALLFFTSTWLVKLTFLLFYRSLFEISAIFRKTWWAVLVFIVVSYWIPVAGVITQCGPTKNAFNIKECTSPQHIVYQHQVLRYTCAMSVITDVMIMALPIWMLKGLKIRTPQKIGLALMFSLGFVIILFDILRTVKSLAQTSFSEVAVYDIVECCVAVVVSCIPTYRSLLNSDRRRKDSQYVNLKHPSGTGRGQPLRDIKSASMSDTSRTEHEQFAPEPQSVRSFPDTPPEFPRHTQV